MIKINQLSEEIHDVMVERFKISKHTSIKAWLMYLSTIWREAEASIHDKECSKFVYSHLELVLADLILLIIALLYNLGVRNIENLLRRRLEENERKNKMKLQK